MDFLKDATWLGCLGIALTTVYITDLVGDSDGVNAANGDPSSNVSEIKEQEQVVTQTKTIKIEPKKSIGVTPVFFDDMGRLLKTLGEGYKYSVVELDELLDPRTYDKFDILFLTCGDASRSWLGAKLRDAERGRESFRVKPEVAEKLRANLRYFVERGGTLYASDWRFRLLANAFNERVDWRHLEGNKNLGDEQKLMARVVDNGLRDVLGSQIELDFEEPSWYPAAFRGSDMTTYLEGTYETMEGSEATAPLLVKFPFGDAGGSVIFTAFHNEKQNSELELKLLKFLVFATVTAHQDHTITKRLIRGGFSPSSKSLLSASSSDAPSVTRTYKCEKPGALQFVLGFEDAGARLKLAIESPDGKKYEDERASTFLIEVPSAMVGDWKYTVTAVQVPYANFPFSLTIGAKTVSE